MKKLDPYRYMKKGPMKMAQGGLVASINAGAAAGKRYKDGKDREMRLKELKTLKEAGYTIPSYEEPEE